MAIRAIGKVVESFKVEKKHKHTFKPYGAIVYDSRILKFKFPDKVSISTLEGRQVIPFLFQNYRNLDMRRVAGQADLVYQAKTVSSIWLLVLTFLNPRKMIPKNFLELISA
jgi:hypothetical protein